VLVGTRFDSEKPGDVVKLILSELASILVKSSCCIIPSSYCARYSNPMLCKSVRVTGWVVDVEFVGLKKTTATREC
jgi:hypothetical protein